MDSSAVMMVLSVGVNTALTPAATKASAAICTSAVVVPFFSMYWMPFSSQKALASAMAWVEESSLRSYSRPMVSISGSAARIRFMMAAVFRASEVPVMFSPPSKPAAAGSVTAEYTTGISVSSTAASMVAAVGVATATITSTPSATRSAPIWFRLLWSACALA